MSQTWLLGRAPGCDVVIEDPAVSRRHTRVSRTPGGYVVEDLGSGTGTRVNGNPVSGDPVPVGPHDVIEVGPHSFTISRGPLAEAMSRKPATAEPRQEVAAKSTKTGRNMVLVVLGVLLALGGIVLAVVVGQRTTEPTGPATTPSGLPTADATGAPPVPGVDAGPTAATDRRPVPQWAFDAIFMIAIETDGNTEPIGTGFVPLDKKVLLTNQHVADPIARLCLSAGACTGFIIGNKRPDLRLKVTREVAHPSATRTETIYHPDIAFLEVESPERLPRGIPLSFGREVSDANLQGTKVYIIGFPGDTMDVGHPNATIDEGMVGRITGSYIQHSASMSPGNSGSPLLTRGPKVVGVNYAGLGARMIAVQQPDGSVSVEKTPTGSGLNLAVGARFVRELLDLPDQ